MKLVQASNDPDKVLTTPTERIEDFKEVPTIELKLRTAIRLNVDKDGRPNLVGLAANQVGIGKSVTVILIGHNDGDYQWLTMVNPKIVSYGTEREAMVEGCGSLREPQELFYEVTRPVDVSVRYQTPTGHTNEMELHGFDARVAQHEIDHLNGHLISETGRLVDSSETE